LARVLEYVDLPWRLCYDDGRIICRYGSEGEALNAASKFSTGVEVREVRKSHDLNAAAAMANDGDWDVLQDYIEEVVGTTHEQAVRIVWLLKLRIASGAVTANSVFNAMFSAKYGPETFTVAGLGREAAERGDVREVPRGLDQ